MHKIFKLCGSPPEEYWIKPKLPHATIFKPQRQYPRRIGEIFRDCPPSTLELLDTLLSIQPEDRGTATSALQSKVSSVPQVLSFNASYGFFMLIKLFNYLWVSAILNMSNQALFKPLRNNML